MQLATVTLTGTTKSTTVSDVVFGDKVNAVLLAQAVRVYRARARQGTSKTKTRAEVARTKKKWFKQKGTGNARHGARTPNIFVGGGVSHGPNGMQNWSLDLPQSMKHGALTSALSANAANTFVAEELMSLKKNPEIRKTVQNIQGKDLKVLIIVPVLVETLVKAVRNMHRVILTTSARVNALEVTQADKIIITPEAIEAIEKRLSGITEEVTVEVEAEVVAKPKAAAKPKASAKPKAPAKTAAKKAEVKTTKVDKKDKNTKK